MTGIYGGREYARDRSYPLNDLGRKSPAVRKSLMCFGDDDDDNHDDEAEDREEEEIRCWLVSGKSCPLNDLGFTCV